MKETVRVLYRVPKCAFVDKSDAFGNRSATNVLGGAPYKDAVRFEGFEREASQHGDGIGNMPLSFRTFANPIANFKGPNIPVDPM